MRAHLCLLPRAAILCDVPAFEPDAALNVPQLPTSGTKRSMWWRLKQWKPLAGWSLGMVQTYFLTALFVAVFFLGVWHCRAYRVATEVECNNEGCTVSKWLGGEVENKTVIARTQLITTLATRMEEGAVVDIKGLKKRWVAQCTRFGATSGNFGPVVLVGQLN